MVKKLGSLPVGSLVKDPKTTIYGKPIVWKIADIWHKGYPRNTVTLITDKVISIKAFDAMEPKNFQDDRKKWGSNRYKYSNLLQWLNSDSEKWYSPMHAADMPPNSKTISYGYPYENEPGFLSNFSPGFKKEIVKTTLKTVRCEIDGGDSEYVDSKIFLASVTEVGFDDENEIAEGEILMIFTGGYNSDRKARLTDEAVSNKYYKSVGNKPGDTFSWWLRTPKYSGSSSVRCVYSDGSSNWFDAGSDGYGGVRPLCNLKSDILVSEEDSRGIYTMVFNNPPTIESTTSTNMGEKSEEFSLNYTVKDEDAGQSIMVEEYLDNRKIRDLSASSGASYTFSLSRSAYQKISNGNHKIKIIAKDSEGGVAEKVFNFSKNETKILFTLEKPLVADAMVTRALISYVGSIPTGAIMKIEACNNGNDSSPTWEDVTQKVLAQKKIFLTNKKKTASKWGFNVRVSVERNGATGECYISSIGGNFE